VHYFVNGGVYQGLGCGCYHGDLFQGQLLADPAEVAERCKSETLSFIWGQTCDGVDFLVKNKLLPRLEMGDWLLFHATGSENNQQACNFNGFPLPKTFYA